MSDRILAGKTEGGWTLDRGHNLPLYSPVCSLCRHFKPRVDGRSCAAFPAGIPLTIWTGENDHRAPYGDDDDGSILFERAGSATKHLPGQHDQREHGNWTRGKRARVEEAVEAGRLKRRDWPGLPGMPQEGFDSEFYMQRAEAERKIRRIESQIAGNDFETLVIFNQDGSEAFQLTGSKSEVKITEEQAEAMLDKIATHNHPGNGGFSIDDVAVFQYHGLREMRAVTDYGTYVLRRTGEIPPEFERQGLSYTLLTRSLRETNFEVFQVLNEKVRAGSITAEQATAAHWDTVMQETESEFGQDLGFEYEFIPAPYNQELAMQKQEKATGALVNPFRTTKHLPGQHDQREHGNWAEGMTSGGGKPAETEVGRLEAEMRRRQETGPEYYEEMAADLYRKLKEEGGFTYQPLLDDSPATGFVVAPYPQYEAIFDGTTLTLSDIAAYLDKHEDVFAKPDHYFGGWFDTDADKFYLDISIVLQDKARAIDLGRQHNQEGIFDLGSFETIIIKDEAERRKSMTYGEFMQWLRRDRTNG